MFSSCKKNKSKKKKEKKKRSLTGKKEQNKTKKEMWFAEIDSVIGIIGLGLSAPR